MRDLEPVPPIYKRNSHAAVKKWSKPAAGVASFKNDIWRFRTDEPHLENTTIIAKTKSQELYLHPRNEGRARRSRVARNRLCILKHHGGTSSKHFFAISISPSKSGI